MAQDLTPKTKVLAYITRTGSAGEELLVFEHRDHREAGVQVPAGTVDPGEEIHEALLREVKEEAGISFQDPGVHLGTFEWIREDRQELHFRNVFHLRAPAGLPDRWSQTVGGEGDDGGLVFLYFWIPLEEAGMRLAADQGIYWKMVPGT